MEQQQCLAIKRGTPSGLMTAASNLGQLPSSYFQKSTNGGLFHHLDLGSGAGKVNVPIYRVNVSPVSH